MSFSRSASGDEASIREQVSHWHEQQNADDNANTYLTPLAKTGHAAQIEIGAKAANLLLDMFPGRVISIGCSGHADQNGAGSVNVNYGLSTTGDATGS